jgi:hypothetical protein
MSRSYTFCPPAPPWCVVGPLKPRLYAESLWKLQWSSEPGYGSENGLNLLLWIIIYYTFRAHLEEEFDHVQWTISYRFVTSFTITFPIPYLTCTARVQGFTIPGHIWKVPVKLRLFGRGTTLYLLEQGFSTGVPRNPRVPGDVARGSARDRDWKKKHRFLNLLAKINRSTEK